ncbi:TIGR00282 family metallophosphoesterase [candidate division WOR-3 bacterium]|uniref:TIGR00282 family metallophosphoesterase n=1 Tax=candidate division WOR-3 bacterium TaxID=2052148 RepID=A0A937XC82_UNCW3|nr:TIGR00282 family metallophosphoesterase [candidate division WOR-3 bacterium]
MSVPQPLRGALRVLFLGDICAEPGRKAVEQELVVLRQQLGVDFVIANAENAAGGYGITPAIAGALLKAGVGCITTGDHAYDRKEVWEYLGTEPRILRPLNFPPQAPGRGYGVYELGQETKGTDAARVKVAVVNLQGRVFMKALDCPFRTTLPALDEIRRETQVVFVDLHAEATAEKQAMGWFLDGRVSAVLGSHTHVQTADEAILAGGTAYITDAGMSGSFDSVLGMSKDLSLRRMVEMVPVRLHPATGDVRINGVWVDVEPASGRALAVGRLSHMVVPAGNQTSLAGV